MTAIDDAVFNITKALKRNDMFDNTIIFYSSGNNFWAYILGLKL